MIRAPRIKWQIRRIYLKSIKAHGVNTEHLSISSPELTLETQR